MKRITVRSIQNLLYVHDNERQTMNIIQSNLPQQLFYSIFEHKFCIFITLRGHLLPLVFWKDSAFDVGVLIYFRLQIPQFSAHLLIMICNNIDVIFWLWMNIYIVYTAV